MQHRPWAILIISFFYLIEPLTKVLFLSAGTMISPLQLMVNEFQQNNLLYLFEFFILFPMAGFALLNIKKWSLPVFVGANLWVFIDNLSYLRLLFVNDFIFFFIAFTLFSLVNIGVCLYLLHSRVRIAFLDSTLRWWEQKTRYKVDLPCTIAGETYTIKNISETGTFLMAEKDSLKDVKILIKFNVENIHLEIDAFVVDYFTINGVTGAGMKFINNSKRTRQNLKKIIRILKKKKTTSRPPERNSKDLLTWLKNIFKTRELEAMFPEVMRRGQK